MINCFHIFIWVHLIQITYYIFIWSFKEILTDASIQDHSGPESNGMKEHYIRSQRFLIETLTLDVVYTQ